MKSFIPDTNLLISVFEQNGYQLHRQPRTDVDTPVLLHCNSTAEGQIRWVWPKGSKKANCLRFYQASNLRSKLIQYVFEWLFKIGLEQLLNKKTILFYTDHVTATAIKAAWGTDYALFMGTPGPNRKLILWHGASKTGVFQKLAISNASLALLENETNSLTNLWTLRLQNWILPAVLNETPGTTTYTDIRMERSVRASLFSHTHALALQELYTRTLRVKKIGNLLLWQQTQHKLSQLSARTDHKIPSGLIRKLQYLANSISEDHLVAVATAHGDFTPWNMYIQENRVAAYDWELCTRDAPILWDAFHFVLQSDILLHRKSPAEMLTDLTLLTQDFWTHPACTSSTQQKQSFELYLLMHTTYYLDIYSNQEHWHTQVHWLINAWSMMISVQLFQKNRFQCRELLAMDLIDHLHQTPYAVLKWKGIEPENLPSTSDIDLCIGTNEAGQLIQFLEQHPLAKHIAVNRLSFMRSVTGVGIDESRLSIDLISKFMRKQFVFLDARQILNNLVVQQNGVKVPSVDNDFTYTWLFYWLNGAGVPQHHLNWFKAAGAKLPQHPSSGITTWEQLAEYNKLTGSAVEHSIRRSPGNTLFNRLVNSGYYLADSIRKQFRKGLVITFSGVDGAGKSTIIDSSKQLIEKTFRKRVVVLRHRPSLFPILSAYTKGKSVAEQAAATRLPRQGSNSNLLSSFIRFLYYYLDYLIGQFYIQLRYVSRGYIVLYDRYYFDFINDAKRSNIELPSGFTRPLYRFLLKPDLNFFLYAEPEQILKRKKELDAPTIALLNTQYQQLFIGLNKKYRTSRYILVKNEEIDTTLKTVLTHINNCPI